ncbi:MAG TPA: biotin carboxylase N-terminal domain-containing protein, partial [Acidimicrobiia bacterium]|nr:biotin carboxylase N-terminal domain-containing protein [Acidimicrobiia bacterium]
VRIIRACYDEGLETVLAVSAADRESLGARLADRIVVIGPAAAAESYLDVDRIMAAAMLTGCDALHPGYGFLSERPELPAACEKAGIAFVGPGADAMRASGDKAVARALARSLDVPVGVGTDIVASPGEAAEAAGRVGFPVLLKAAAGGGGRGMRRVDSPDGLAAAWAAASTEAEAAFGDGRLFVERFVRRARHVEVQVLADRHGNVVHLGERDCSLQRRYQKLVEEAPAVGLPDEIRAAMHAAAVRMIGAVGYEGAATCEFLVDAEKARDGGIPPEAAFGFLEINARLQVEHPVTEMVTGFDLVREQLRIAAGRPLSFTQADVALTGSAMEVRINAESPEDGFLPCPGRLDVWAVPVGSDVRVDTACFPGWEIPPHYDSLLAKVIVWGDDRPAALARMRHALDHLRVEGVPTTAPFARAVLDHPDVVGGSTHTTWLEDTFLAGWPPTDAQIHPTSDE